MMRMPWTVSGQFWLWLVGFRIRISWDDIQDPGPIRSAEPNQHHGACCNSYLPPRCQSPAFSSSEPQEVWLPNITGTADRHNYHKSTSLLVYATKVACAGRAAFCLGYNVWPAIESSSREFYWIGFLFPFIFPATDLQSVFVFLHME